MKKKLLAVLIGVMCLGAAVACNQAGEEVAEETAEVVEEVTEDEEMPTAEEEYEAVKATLTYMGGLYISEEDNDLTLVLVRDQNEGNIVAIVSKLDTFTYGIIETENKTTDDGVEYTAFTLDGNEYGYCFNEDYTTGGILVDSDGTVYEAKFVDESAAQDYIAQAH